MYNRATWEVWTPVSGGAERASKLAAGVAETGADGFGGTGGGVVGMAPEAGWAGAAGGGAGVAGAAGTGAGAGAALGVGTPADALPAKILNLGFYIKLLNELTWCNNKQLKTSLNSGSIFN